MPYAELLPQLLELKLVEKCTMQINPEKLPPNFNANAKCELHSGVQGHSIENCMAFKHKVQDLLDSQAINFGPTPNITSQPLPPHGGDTVSVITQDESLNLVMDVNQLMTPSHS